MDRLQLLRTEQVTGVRKLGVMTANRQKADNLWKPDYYIEALQRVAEITTFFASTL